MSRIATIAAVLTAALLAAAAAGCGSGGSSLPPFGNEAVPADFSAVLERAEGETVHWWMYGGDERVNAYVDEVVKPAAAKLGVTLVRVPISDTADAVQRVVSERRAGRDSGGAVDLIWINGENFAAGKEAGLWLHDWVTALPNARYVDLGDPSISLDLQVATDGEEAPWSRAAFVFAYDRDRTPDPPGSFDELLAYAKVHPGRVTYPAPPDFTGSAFVRQLVQRLGSRERAFAFLRELKPYQYEGGRVFPKSEAELNELFANGQVDFTMSYDPSFVQTGVARGTFPGSARPFLIGGGALVNTSYVTIPANAANVDGALVVANLLLDPELQAIKADPDELGIPTVLDPARLSADQRRLFDGQGGSPYLLSSFGTVLPELPAAEVGEIEAAWIREVLR